MAKSEWNGMPLPPAWCMWPAPWKREVIAYLQGNADTIPQRWSELTFREKQLVVWHLCAVGSVSAKDNSRVRLLGGTTAFAATYAAKTSKSHAMMDVETSAFGSARAQVLAYRDRHPNVLEAWRTAMLYPKPNGGKRVLPSVYTKLTTHWLRANGVYQRPERMNQGHLANTIALLNESHVNLVDRMSDVLGRMHNHLGNRPDLQEKIVDLFHELEVLQVEDLYPIIELLASHVEPELEVNPADLYEDDSWIREF